jgi:hypothetical protein
MNLRQQTTHTLAKITSGFFLTTAMSMLIALPLRTNCSPVLWNKLGSSSEVLNSAYGPNLSFYGGGDPFGIVGNPAYVPGVFGNALSIGPGSYTAGLREHTVIWNNVNNYLNADRGTISIWYKQNLDPVGFSYGVYRLFDGSYGLDSGIGLSADADNNALNFGVSFGGTLSSVSYNVSAYNGTWIHVGGVWDRAGIDGSLDKLRLYINGAVVGTSQNGSWGNVVGTRADIGGGNDNNIAGKFAIDNLQVFNTAVTDFSGRFVEAVPEPATASLAALAAIGAMLWRRRR